MAEKGITAYITKYALTTGKIEKVVATKLAGAMIEVTTGDRDDGYMPVVYYHRNEWFPSLKLAEERVRHMVLAKIKSLEKARAKVVAIGKSFGMEIK